MSNTQRVTKVLALPSRYGKAFEAAEKAYRVAVAHGASGERAFEIAIDAYTRTRKSEATPAQVQAMTAGLLEVAEGMTIDEWTAEYGPTTEEREADKARHSLVTDDEWEEAA